MIEMTTTDATTCPRCHQAIEIGAKHAIEVAPGLMGRYHPACGRAEAQEERQRYETRRTARTTRRPAQESQERKGYMIDRGEDN